MAASPLAKVLNDSEAEVRNAAARALGMMGKKASFAIPVLTRALQDPDEKVRASAAWAISNIKR